MSIYNSNIELINAISNNEKKAIEIFKTKNFNIISEDYKILKCAVRFNANNFVKLLLLEDFTISKENSDIIFTIAFENKSFDVLYLILEDARFESLDITINVFSYACMLANKHIFNLLLNDPRVDINKYNSTPLLFAIIGGDINIVRAILENEKFNGEYLKTNNLKYITGSIKHDNINLYKILLNAVTDDDKQIKNLNAIILKEAIKNKKHKLTKSLIKENNFILSISLNMFFVNNYSKYDFEIFELILNIKGFDASSGLNKMISYCMILKKLHEVDLLWKRNEVKNTLKKDDISLYLYLKRIDINNKLKFF